ncbi:hypothetical protein KY349_00530, partial [Candidatus Woesearchaeota archaeon]|nr:hypothetical protein [Candidatus Woesearchaeota archaeon]
MSSEEKNKKPLEHILFEEGLTPEEERALNDSLDILNSDLGRETDRREVKKGTLEQEIAMFSYRDHTAAVLKLSDQIPGSGLEMYQSTLKKYNNVSTVVVGKLEDIEDPDKQSIVKSILEKYLKEDNRQGEIPKLLHVEDYSEVGDALTTEGVFSIFEEPG